MSSSPSICFAAAGWLKVYYYGVARALQKRVDLSNVRFGGSSAGTLVSACLILGVDFDELMEFTITCVKRCRGSPLGPFKLEKYIDECFDLYYNEEAMHRAQGRLFIYTTEFPTFRQRVVSHFRDKEELRFWMKMSCNLPVFFGLPRRANKFLPGATMPVWVYDGGARTFCPMLDEHSITVSCFGKADIRPEEAIPMQYGLYPPPPKVVWDLYYQGERDANVWISRAAYSVPERPLRTGTVSGLRPFTSTPVMGGRSAGASLTASGEASSPQRHKLQIGIELIPPPQTRRRVFLVQQVVRSLGELLLLVFSVAVLFPFLFIATGIERVVLTWYHTWAVCLTTIAHYGLLCRSRNMEELAAFYRARFFKAWGELLEFKIWLGTIVPGLSHYIGTRLVGREQMESMSATYRWVRHSSSLLDRYENPPPSPSVRSANTAGSSNPSNQPYHSPMLPPSSPLSTEGPY
mmetsp:Transcript_31186/g.87456  ORF Transcript_31186/g.87456 Transcript_31186/m.87456 type:complete len:463 (+) Transcript_31186:139-1527(+)|eukprot:CAMPEP_0119127914 /NCGR_PEP_ID=MMETSP1310-20130426/6272_1 /TAXON_ID=464262 /ORGANISM="Genus nov. species nov., Strain RCC2339" /LENGTH=462 /DNA_ID=CAMNT_0007118201 /DNA_START=326 /DNA_END=1714 /DNA_ORIENTATION=-